MNYNKEKFCKLEDGSVEKLYYGNDYRTPRNFYQENGKWYLDHDVYIGCGIAYCHSLIVEFLTDEQAKEYLKSQNIIVKDKKPSPLKGLRRSQIGKLSAANKTIKTIDAYIYGLERLDNVDEKTKKFAIKMFKDLQRNIKENIINPIKKGKGGYRL